jgi:hypothetical protein
MVKHHEDEGHTMVDCDSDGGDNPAWFSSFLHSWIHNGSTPQHNWKVMDWMIMMVDSKKHDCQAFLGFPC